MKMLIVDSEIETRIALKLRVPALALLVFHLIIASFPSSTAASPPRPGSTCKKLGATQTFEGKKYTCIKSGKKLVWNKGVLEAKPQPSATPTPNPSPTISPTLPPTPTPTPTSSTTPSPSVTPSPTSSPPFETSSTSKNVDLCKLKYSLGGETGFGFPRSANRLPAQGTIRAIFIFVDFPDAIGTDIPAEVARTYFDSFNEFYKQVSYGKVQFTFSVPNRYFRINKPSDSYGMNLSKNEKNYDVAAYFQDALAASDPYVDFSLFDVVYVIPSNTVTEITYGPSFPMGAGNSLLKTNEKVFYSGAVGGTDSRQRVNSAEWVWLAHETGHLFGLEHPWKVEADAQGRTTISSSVAIWDLMLSMWNSAPKAHEFLGWTRFLIGWLEGSQINCQQIDDPNWSTLNLRITPIEKSSKETKLALIKISDTTAIAIESRRNLGFDQVPESYSGTLVYLVDVTKKSNEGMATLISDNTQIVNGTSIGTMRPGSKVSFSGLQIEILFSDSDADYVRITRLGALPSASTSPTPLSTPTPTKTPRFNATPDCGPNLKACPKVTVESSLPIAQCKISDSSARLDASMSMGFPRPSFIQQQNSNPRVLVVPVSFADLRFKDPNSELQSELLFTQDKYRQISYGRVNLNFTVLQDNGVFIDKRFGDYKNENNSDLGLITEKILNLINYPQLANYDAVVLTTPRSDSINWGGGNGAGAAVQTRFGPVGNYYLYVGGPLMTQTGDSINKSLAHELGHVLYALSDTYISAWALKDAASIPTNLLFYDLMQNGFSDDFHGWVRWLNGWIYDTEVNCIDTTNLDGVIYLRYLESTFGKRLAVLPITSNKTLILEYRNASTHGYPDENLYSSSGKGLLIYQFDSTVRQGYGQFTGAADGQRLFVNGESIIFQGFNFTISGVDGDGMYISIKRRD